MRFQTFLKAVLLGASALSGGHAFAAPRSWDAQAGTADWFTALNWSSNLLPTSVDTVYINNWLPSPVLSGSAASILSLRIGQTSNSVGALTIEGGGYLNAEDTYLGHATGATGTVNIIGPSSALQTSTAFRVGSSANSTGNLNVANGGSLITFTVDAGRSAGSHGTINLTGAGSSWVNSSGLYLGVSGSGSLGIHDGASVQTGTFASATSPISNATITLSDPDSVLSVSGTFAVGNRGNVQFIVENGAALNTSGASYIGWGATTDNSANGFLAVSDATWFVGPSTLRIGVFGTGTLNIVNGGQVTGGTGNVYVGTEVGATGIVNISGAGSVWQHSSTLHTSIGERGTGALTVSDGGAGIFTNLYLGGSTGSGTLLLTGQDSSISVSDSLIVGNRGNAMMTIADGASFTANTALFGSNAGVSAILNIGAALGDVAIAPGVFNVEQISFGGGMGSIVFNHTDDNYVLSTDLVGNGILNFVAGTTYLSGDNTAFSGDVLVTGGVLGLDGIMNATMTVSDGGRAQGSGSIDTLILDSGGTLAPGNSIGTLNVVNAAFNAGSNYEVELNGAGQSDLLDAVGTVTITGGNVQAISYPDFVLDTRYTIIRTGSGVTGVFDSVSDDFLLFDGQLTYDANNVYLALVPSSAAAAVAQTPNQRAVNRGIQGSSRNNAAVRAYYSLATIDAARAALDMLSGEIHPAVGSLMREETQRVRRSLPVAGNSGASRVWIKALGSSGDVEATNNSASVDTGSSGVLAGVEYNAAEGGRLGFGLGVSESKLNIDDRRSEADIASYHAVAYTHIPISHDGLEIAGGLTVSHHSIETSRAIRFDGFDEASRADYAGQSAQAHIGLSRAIGIGASSFISPYAELSLTASRLGSFTESGEAGLRSDGQWDRTGAITLGADYDHHFDLGSAQIVMEGGLGYQHGVGDAQINREMRFNNGGAQDFNTRAAPLDRHAALIDAGIGAALNENAQISLSYAGKLSADRKDHSISAQLKWSF